MDKINLDRKYSLFNEQWQPKNIARVADCLVKIAKIQGEFEWHAHPDEDELFLIHRGRLTLAFRDREVVLEKGEMIVVPKGVEHKPWAEEECWIMMIEPVGTINTGDAGGDRTVDPEWI